MLRKLYLLVPLLSIAAVLLAGGPSLYASESRDLVAAEISALLGQTEPEAQFYPELGPLVDVRKISGLYAERRYRPLWLVGSRLHPAAGQLVEHLRNAPGHGLCSSAYLLNELETLLRLHDSLGTFDRALAPFSLATLDILLSQSFLKYATHLVEGQVDPALAHVDWRARRRKADLAKLLDYALTNDRLDQVLAGLMPPHIGYAALTAALQNYRTLAALGGWPVVPAGDAMRLGDRDARLPLLRKRLALTGDLDLETVGAGEVYGSAEQVAVRDFQARHGLIEDGVVGPRTLAALNVPVAQRIRQIELNLERWRWLPKELGERHIRINIADFSLQLVEDGRPVLSMPVVVGTAYRKTPVFSARMTYLEFAPTWIVPPTILREDKLPAIKANPGYLDEHHFRILQRQDGEWVEIEADRIAWEEIEAEKFPGLLRQDPGPWNPLGRVKFMFPNSFNVYLHDTNQPQLFLSNRRSYSSGCIRIERPVELANYLLADVPDWDSRRIEAALRHPEPIRAKIPPVPVHIQYWTVWVDEKKRVQFRPDIYHRDLDLEVALSEPGYQVEINLEINRSGG